MRTTMLLAVCALSLPAPQAPPWRSFQGGKPPEIDIPKENWLGAEGGLTLGKLKGKVVWLEFIGSVF